VGREVLELGVVSVGHDPNVWKALGNEVSKPHDLGLLVSPCVKGMAVKAMNRDETGFNVRTTQMWLYRITCSKTVC
jgi:hypothetical protein